MPFDSQGLLAGFQEGYAMTDPKLREARAKDARDMSMDQKKMELAKQLEMQIWKMKEQYAQQFPEYVHFVKTPEGITGITKYGQERLVHASTPDELAEDKQKTQLGFDAQKALIEQRNAAAGASTENAKTNAEYRKQMGQASLLRANKPGAATKYDESAIYQRNLNAALKELMPPKLSANAALMDENATENYNNAVQAAQQKAQELATQRTKAEVSRLSGGGGLLQPQQNDFMNLINPPQAPQEEEELSPADQ